MDGRADASAPAKLLCVGAVLALFLRIIFHESSSKLAAGNTDEVDLEVGRAALAGSDCTNADSGTLDVDVGSTVVRLCHTGSLLVETDGHTITRLETARREVAEPEAGD